MFYDLLQTRNSGDTKTWASDLQCLICLFKESSKATSSNEITTASAFQMNVNCEFQYLIFEGKMFFNVGVVFEIRNYSVFTDRLFATYTLTEM